MTAMFVQLRRAVYLLVLLQCFHVCLVDADDGGVDAPAPLSINYTNDDISAIAGIDEDLKRVLKHTLLKINESHKPFANGTACRTVWDEAVKENNESIKRVADAVKRIEKLDKKIEGYMKEKEVGGRKVLEPALKEEVKEDVIKTLVDEVNAELKKSKNDIPNAERVRKIDEAVYARYVCLSVRGNVVDSKNNLERILESYVGFEKDLKKSVIAREVKEAAESRRDALKKVLEGLQKVEWESKRSISRAKEQVRIWEKAMGRFAQLREMIVGRWKGDVQHNVVLKEKDNVIAEINNTVSGKKKEIGDLINEVNEDTIERRRKVGEGIKQNVEKANVQQAARNEDEMREAIKEKARRDAEERARKAREEEEERERRKKAEEERAKRAREEEEERERRKKAEEERAKRVKEEEEEKARRKKAEEERAKGVKEEVERAKKAKKKDGAVRPSLVHSPLLLLVVLISVLGCTLVC